MSSSRGVPRRRDRSWERDDRDRDRDRPRDRGRYESSRGGGGRGYRDEKRRSSRSRSPRRGDKDRDRDSSRRERRDRDYDHRRNDVRRDGDSDRRDDKRRDRDDRREPTRREDKVVSSKEGNHPRDVEMKELAGSRTEPSSHPEPPRGSLTSSARPSVDPKTPEHIHEDGETLEDTNDDDVGMMAAMGLTGFGSTKGKHVEGNQEGTADVKRTRTWRQYMNRRGGFNRPLDKIK